MYSEHEKGTLVRHLLDVPSKDFNAHHIQGKIVAIAIMCI